MSRLNSALLTFNVLSHPIAVIMTLFLSMTCLLPASAQDLYREKVILNGQEIPLERLFRNQNNVLYAPIELLKERITFTHQYNSTSKILILKSRDTTIKLQTGNTLAVINESWKYMKAPPQDIDGNIIIPLMDVAEYLGAKATYQGFLPMAEEKAINESQKPGEDSPFRFPPSLDTPTEHPSQMTPDTTENRESVPANPDIAVQRKYAAPKKRYVEESRQMAQRESAEFSGKSAAREKRRVIFRKPVKKQKPESSQWSMKGKVGIGAVLSSYQPDGGDIRGSVESHMLWGGRFAAGISNHWSLEAMVEEWEDSQLMNQYSNFPLPGDGKLSVQPATFSLKCHFMKDSQFKPYLAIGATRYNVGFSFADSVNTPYSGKDTCWGPSLQAGGEYFLTRNFSMFSGFRYGWGRIGFDLKPLLRFVEIQLQDFYWGAGLNLWFN